MRWLTAPANRMPDGNGTRLFRTVILYIFIIQQNVLDDKEYSQSADEGNCGSIYWNYKNTDIIGHFKECYLWTRTLFSWFFLGLFKLLLKTLLKKHGICLIRWAMYLIGKGECTDTAEMIQFLKYLIICKFSSGRLIIYL